MPLITHIMVLEGKKKFDRECKMATRSDVMPASVAYRAFSKGGSGLKPPQASRHRPPQLPTQKGKFLTSGGCVPANNLLRAEALLLRAERLLPKDNSFSACCVSVTSGADRKLLCFASRWLRGCIWNIIWTVRAGWRRGSGVIEWRGGSGLRNCTAPKSRWSESHDYEGAP